jgi:hypothetical protein
MKKTACGLSKYTLPLTVKISQPGAKPAVVCGRDRAIKDEGNREKLQRQIFLHS